MIQYKVGNLLESEAEALVNTVNTVGVMGKGIALQFKNQFPNNFKNYQIACKNGTFLIGQLLVNQDTSLLFGEKTIINFPTKTDWRKPSEYSFIEIGLQALVRLIEEKKFNSIAVPPLGAGNGGLDWASVKMLIERYLSSLDCSVYVYEPNEAVREVLRKERVLLTPARAMLLAVAFDLVRHGECLSEFAAEKICYFLQRFGGKEAINLDFEPKFYGPYSGKVKHVLYFLNGSYLSGYADKNAKPFEELNLFMDAEPDILAFLHKMENQKALDAVDKTKRFLQGFYGYFSLELLSTLDFLVEKNQKTDLESIKNQLADWSHRKTDLFSNDFYLQKGLKQIEKFLA
jgi:O-acetyl-ADP-ribose deacetylase (regulator of RNase III)